MIREASGVANATNAVEVGSPVMVFVRIHGCYIHPLLEVVDMHGVSAKTFNRHLAFTPQSAVRSSRVIVMAGIAVSGCLKIAVHMKVSSK